MKKQWGLSVLVAVFPLLLLCLFAYVTFSLYQLASTTYQVLPYMIWQYVSMAILGLNLVASSIYTAKVQSRVGLVIALGVAALLMIIMVWATYQFFIPEWTSYFNEINLYAAAYIGLFTYALIRLLKKEAKK